MNTWGTGDVGSKVKSYYKMYIFTIKNLTGWNLKYVSPFPPLVREEPLRCLNCIGITGCDGSSSDRMRRGSPVVYLTEISFYCQTCESGRKLLNIYQGTRKRTKCFYILTEIFSLEMAGSQESRREVSTILLRGGVKEDNAHCSWLS